MGLITEMATMHHIMCSICTDTQNSGGNQTKRSFAGDLRWDGWTIHDGKATCPNCSSKLAEKEGGS